MMAIMLSRELRPPAEKLVQKQSLLDFQCDQRAPYDEAGAPQNSAAILPACLLANRVIIATRGGDGNCHSDVSRQQYLQPCGRF
jgi:hypothetical protein